MYSYNYKYTLQFHLTHAVIDQLPYLLEELYNSKLRNSVDNWKIKIRYYKEVMYYLEFE